MHQTITCIVPFYNEANRISATLDELSQSKYITEIIAVDDGSTDRPQIKTSRTMKLLTLPSNSGKSEAILEGLQSAQGEYILMIDADLKELDVKEIDRACQKIIAHPEIDMLILRSTNATWITRLCRQDIVLSGARLLRNDDFKKVYKNKPKGYQIETAINTYMIRNNKKCYYTPFSAYNTLRSEKIGLVKGFFGLLYLLHEVYTYEGYLPYIWQLFTFCHEELT